MPMPISIRRFLVAAVSERDGAFQQWEEADRELRLVVAERDSLVARIAGSAGDDTRTTVDEISMVSDSTGHTLTRAFEALDPGLKDPHAALAAVDALLQVAATSPELLEHRGIILSRLGDSRRRSPTF